MTPSGNEVATCRLVAQCLNQVRRREPRHVREAEHKYTLCSRIINDEWQLRRKQEAWPLSSPYSWIMLKEKRKIVTGLSRYGREWSRVGSEENLQKHQLKWQELTNINSILKGCNLGPGPGH